VHSYYHLVLLVLSYCSVGYLSDSIDHSRYLRLSDSLTLLCFLIFHQLTRKHLVILADVVSGCITFSEVPRLA
jgi:predicted aminopeptidase